MAADEEDTQVKTMEQLYPKLLTDQYFVPPVYFNRVPWRPEYVGGQKVMIVHIASSEPAPRTSRSNSYQSPQSEQHKPDFPRPPQAMYETASDKVGASDTQGNVGAYQVREDFAQQHVLLCLQKLFAQKLGSEPLFVVSQLGFDICLKKTEYKMSELLQTPKDQRLRGDFDILLIHRACGVLIGEIKAVGLSKAGDSPNSLKTAVVKRVLKAAKQLSKTVKVMKDKAEDIHRDLIVRTTLILPYVSRSKLQKILNRHSDKALVKVGSISFSSSSIADGVLMRSPRPKQLSTPAQYQDPL